MGTYKLTKPSCKKCGSTNYEIREKGPHKGMYCTECGAWIAWVSKTSDVENTVEPIGKTWGDYLESCDELNTHIFLHRILSTIPNDISLTQQREMVDTILNSDMSFPIN